MRTCSSDDGCGAFGRGPQAELDQQASALLAAEQEFHAGAIDAATFELVHREVWRRLGPDRLRQSC